jgi:hypothetical protein
MRRDTQGLLKSCAGVRMMFPLVLLASPLVLVKLTSVDTETSTAFS